MNKKTQITAVFLLAMTSTASYSKPAPENTESEGLCTQKEKSLFYCSAGKKTASLCLNKATPQPQVQYRYGTKQNIELIYPENTVNSTNLFKLSSTVLPGGGAKRIRFAIDQYNYYLYVSIRTQQDQKGQYPLFESGVFVTNGQKTIASIPCLNDAGDTASGYELFDKEDFNNVNWQWGE